MQLNNKEVKVTTPENMVDTQVAFRMKEISRLVSLPHITFKLLALLKDEYSTPQDLQKIVEMDPGLTVKLISLSNSSYYSLRQPVVTIAQAIAIIGFKELGFMSMGLGLSETFDMTKAPAGFDSNRLWLHCLSVSWIARELALFTKIADPGELMIAGLLHDLGLIILVSKFTLQFQRLLELMKAGRSFSEAETVLGIKHEVIGYLLAKNWAIPQIFQDSILHHHWSMGDDTCSKSAALVALAESLSQKIGQDLELEKGRTDISNLLEFLEINSHDLEIFVQEKGPVLDKLVTAWLESV